MASVERNAGAQYVAAFARELARQQVQVDVAVPAEPGNRSPSSTEVAQGLVEHQIVRHAPTSFLGVRRRVEHLYHAIDPGDGVLEGFRRSQSFAEVVLGVDAVSVQFAEMMPVGRLVRQLRPTVPMLVMEHDVFTQSVRRGVRSSRMSVRFKSAARAPHVASRERALLDLFDMAYVFKQSDLHLLQRMGVKAATAITNLHVEVQNQSPVDGASTLLFVGSFKRLENVEGAEWFLRWVWPQVRGLLPELRLVFVGEQPPSSLMRYSSPKVQFVGPVDSVAPYYRDAAISIAPLQRGAGVKVKVLEAMSYGVPVVATPIAAEGITGPPDITGALRVAHDADGFAKAVVELGLNEQARISSGVAGQRWIREEMQFEHTVQRIREDIDGLIFSRG